MKEKIQLRKFDQKILTIQVRSGRAAVVLIRDRFVTMSTIRFECILTWRENEETRPAEISELVGGLEEVTIALHVSALKSYSGHSDKPNGL